MQIADYISSQINCGAIHQSRHLILVLLND